MAAVGALGAGCLSAGFWGLVFNPVWWFVVIDFLLTTLITLGVGIAAVRRGVSGVGGGLTAFVGLLLVGALLQAGLLAVVLAVAAHAIE
jgi:hypothetical protein